MFLDGSFWDLGVRRCYREGLDVESPRWALMLNPHIDIQAIVTIVDVQASDVFFMGLRTNGRGLFDFLNQLELDEKQRQTSTHAKV